MHPPDVILVIIAGMACVFLIGGTILSLTGLPQYLARHERRRYEEREARRRAAEPEKCGALWLRRRSY